MHEFGDFLLDLYRLARASPLCEFRPRAMALVRSVVSFDSGRWMQGLRDKPGSFIPQGGILLNESPDMLAAYRDVRPLDRVFHDLLARDCNECIGIAYRSRTCYAGAELTAMREYQQRFAHENVLNVVVNHVDGGMRYWRLLALYRKSEDHLFGAEDLALARRLWPHLLEAHTINRVANLHGQDASVVDAGAALAMAEESRKIIFATGNLRPLLTREWPTWDDSHVPLPIWDCLARGDRYMGQQVVGWAQRIEDMVVVRIRPAYPADRLSSREFEVARRSACGLDYKSIARELGISMATTRNHQQHIYRKLGIHSAAALVSALQPLRLDERPFACLQALGAGALSDTADRIVFESA